MQVTRYEKIGDGKIRKLVHDFYDGVKSDLILSPMYKEGFDVAEERLYLFLIQYLGGPSQYNKRRGHPRLRMRHQKFHINEEAKIHWLTHMENALNKSEIEKDDQIFLLDYFQNTAEFLRNH